LGGPIGVYEQDAYPFLRDELRLLRTRLTAGRPTLGICLGCQLIAQALGGLASTDQYPHQAFSWGNHALALQFHIETTQRGLERWLIGHTGEIAATPGLTVPMLREATAVHAVAAEQRGWQTLIAWLEQVGL